MGAATASGRVDPAGAPRGGGQPRVGLVGAGQLARMTYQAGIALGLTVGVLAAHVDDSAALIGADVVVGDPDAAEDLARLAERSDVVSFDHELVPAPLVAALERAGTVARPGADVLALVQDKRAQRAALAAHGFRQPAHRALGGTPGELADFAGAHGWPVVAKAARGGYDGRGVWVVGDPAQARELEADTAARGVALLAEEHLALQRELAVLVARRPGGESVVYPVVETVQLDGICRELIVPARIHPDLALRAEELGRAIADAVGSVGVLAVELFVVDGGLLVNELAPRPHNSGHFSIEGSVTSQFENHLRAVLDWPLGSTAPRAPAAATVNLLGGPASPDPVLAGPALAVPDARVHLYAKDTRAGRKLGHVTVLGEDAQTARERAWRAVRLLGGAP